MNPRRTILVDITDTHGGHRLGLLNPDVTLEREDEKGNPIAYHPDLTPVQKYLWDLYIRNARETFKISHGDEILVLHHGDECQGNKYVNDLVSDRMSDQILIARANLEIWLQLPNVKYMRLAHGTGAHNFAFGSSTHQVKELLAAKYPQKDIRLCYHGLLEYNGYSIDYAHHGPHPGSRDWLRGNVARFYLRDLMTREIRRGNRPPDMVSRGHYHSPVHEVLEMGQYSSELYVVPSMCGMDDHAQQATSSADEMTFGFLVIEIIDGKKTNEWRMYESLDIRTREVL